MQYYNTGRTIIHYRDWGPRDGKNIVFSNSLGTDSRIWDKVVRKLPSDFRVITYDKRGHGLSTEPKAEMSIFDLASDVSDLIDFLKLKRVNFVGISIGGMIGQVLAFKKPETVSRLILCDTAVKIGSKEIWNERVSLVRRIGLTGMVDSILERWFSPEYIKNNADEMQLLSSMLKQTSETGYVECCKAISQTDLSEVSSKLVQPTTVIVGRNDISTPPELVKATADLIKNSRFAIVDDSGHLPCIDQSEPLAHLISEFIK